MTVWKPGLGGAYGREISVGTLSHKTEQSALPRTFANFSPRLVYTDDRTVFTCRGA